MKALLLYILAVIPLFAFGQKTNTIVTIKTNGEIHWTYEDFIEHKVDRIQAFSFALKKNGKAKKNGTKLFDISLNRDSLIVKGINSNLKIQSFGSDFLSWYKFKKYYDSKVNLLKHTRQAIESLDTKDSRFIEWNINVDETTYEYDERDLLIKKVHNRINYSKSDLIKTKNNSLLLRIQPEIYEYEYNEQGLEIRKYKTNDSTRYIRIQSKTADTTSVKCFYCEARYLNLEKEYDSNGNLIQWTSYTGENEIHSKKYYFYNEKNNLIKQIDSTGWYLQKHTDDEPSLESTKSFEYSNDKLIKIIYIDKERTSISEFDENGELISSCLQIAGVKDECSKYKYVYQNGLIKEIHHLPNQKTIFEYSNEGLLIEKRIYLNEKWISLIRYYYDKENKTNEQKRPARNKKQ